MDLRRLTGALFLVRTLLGAKGSSCLLSWKAFDFGRYFLSHHPKDDSLKDLAERHDGAFRRSFE